MTSTRPEDSAVSTGDAAHAVLDAYARIREHVRHTPLERSPGFGGDDDADVFFKCENLQHTGSFKARGALSKALALDASELARGMVTASTGNHGAACAFALARVGAEATIFVPETASAAKLANVTRHGGRIERYGDDSADTERYARRYAEDHGMVYIPPYNDLDVIGGQGTIGVEILDDLDAVDAVFVSLGGGGLVSGIAAHVKSASPSTQIVACSPSNSQVMYESVRAGHILDLPSLPTLSDGTAGGVEDDAITFPLVRDLVDDYVSVSEQEIADAMRRFIDTHCMLVEGAAGVAIAAYLKTRERWRQRRVVIVLCGGNIALDTLREVVCT